MELEELKREFGKWWIYRDQATFAEYLKWLEKAYKEGENNATRKE